MVSKMKGTQKITITREKMLPFILGLVIIIIDQITKIWVAKNIPFYIYTNGTGYNVYKSFFDGFIEIIHVRNLGVAFSIGYTWPRVIRVIIFSGLPLIVMCYIIYWCLKSNDLSKLQRWCISAVVGGGIGNIIDRIFREYGVVDFISVKWFGWENAWFEFLRWDRWPTFNFADAMIVVFGIIFVISLIKILIKESKEGKK